MGVWELGGYVFDEIWYSNHDDKDWTAYIGYPDCAAVEGGFPGLVIMPGRSLKKIRHKFWVAMFASKMRGSFWKKPQNTQLIMATSTLWAIPQEHKEFLPMV